MTAQEMLWSAVGAEKRPELARASDAFALGAKDLNVPSQSSCTGTQALHAVGAAEAHYRAGLVEGLQDKIDGYQRRRGRLHVGRRRHDQRGRMVGSPQHRVQSQAAGDLHRRGQRLRDLDAGRGRNGGRRHFEARRRVSRIFTFRNATARTCSRATRRSRKRSNIAASGKGPAFVHAKVVRPYSHSLSDDEKLYRPTEELEADAAIDPIKTFRRVPDDGRRRVERGARKNAQGGRRRGQRGSRHRDRDAAACTRNGLQKRIFAGRRSDRPAAFDTEDGAELSRQRRHDGRPDQPLHARGNGP